MFRLTGSHFRECRRLFPFKWLSCSSFWLYCLLVARVDNCSHSFRTASILYQFVWACVNTLQNDSGLRHSGKIPLIPSLSAPDHTFSPYTAFQLWFWWFISPRCVLLYFSFSPVLIPPARSPIIHPLPSGRIRKVMMIMVLLLSGQTSFHYKI